MQDKRLQELRNAYEHHKAECDKYSAAYKKRVLYLLLDTQYA